MHDQKGAGQMEFIYNWILKLSFFAVLGSMILQMLPDHGFQKYVRFVLGLILTAMLVVPVLDLLDKRTAFEEKRPAGKKGLPPRTAYCLRRRASGTKRASPERGPSTTAFLQATSSRLQARGRHSRWTTGVRCARRRAAFRCRTTSVPRPALPDTRNSRCRNAYSPAPRKAATP